MSECYAQQMTAEEKKETLELLDLFHDACDKHHVDYTLCFGTALGQERHRGFIP